MSRLETARQRLERAVARLERAAETCGARAAERATALEAARSEGKALRDVGLTVSSRLDSVIGRLKSSLES